MKLVQKNSMKNAVLTLAITSTLVLTPTLALAKNNETLVQEKQQEHNVELSFGAGAIIGGILGGPVGAFIVGLTGSLMAKDSNSQKNINKLEVALVNQKSTNNTLIAEFQQKLQNAEQVYQNELLAVQQSYQSNGQLQVENLLMSLQFSTGSSDIKPHYQKQIQALANLLRQSPNLTINLSGYTDLQGSEKLNQALSQDRVNSVKAALVNFGINSDRIIGSAFGESAPVVAKTDSEVSFYDRRVVIKLNKNTNQMAKN